MQALTSYILHKATSNPELHTQLSTLLAPDCKARDVSLFLFRPFNLLLGSCWIGSQRTSDKYASSSCSAHVPDATK